MLKLSIVGVDHASIEDVNEVISEFYGKGVKVLVSTGNINSSVKLINQFDPHILVLYVDLGQESGFDLFDSIKHQSMKKILIGYDKTLAQRAIKLEVLDFIKYPVNKDEFVNALNKANRRILSESIGFQRPKRKKSSLLVWEKNKMHSVKIENILKIKADGAYSNIFVQGLGKLYSTKNIGVYERLLSSDDFIRIHNSCLVNIHHVDFYTPGFRAFVTLSDSRIEYVSKNRKRDFLNFYNSLEGIDKD